MDDFLEKTTALTARLQHVLEADSKADWAIRLNGLRSELNEWKNNFTLLVNPSQEVFEAVLAYTSKLTEVLMKGATYRDTAPAAGGRRYTRRYCKKTPCRRMGFTQKASCRPYKNCYLTRS